MSINDRFLKRKLYEIEKNEEGYTINPPAHRGLVLSGGGSKGIAYAGMIKSMHERGFLESLTHVSGASAGAMTASLLAIGMHHEDISRFINEINMINCLDNQGFRIRAVGERARNIFEIMYLYQIKQHMKDIEEPETENGKRDYNAINQKIRMYDSILEKQDIKINTVDDVIAIGQSIEELEKLDMAFKTLPKNMKDKDGKKMESPRIAFADLARLRSILPEDKQHLIKKLYVTTTNQTKSKLIYHGEEYDPGESIAEKVQLSGAHPLIFSPALNEHGEYIADGGILDNMPTLALEKAGLEREEILCVSIETDSQHKDRIAMAERQAREDVKGIHYGLDVIGEHLFGGKILEGDAVVYNREKIFHHIGNMLFINSGSITTTTITPTNEQKQKAIENGYNQFDEWHNSHKQVFSNPLIAMLYLGVENLETLMQSDDNDEEIIIFAAIAQSIFHLQDQLAEQLNQGNADIVEPLIKQIEELFEVEAALTEIEKKRAMALCLKQIDFFTEGKLEKYIVTQVEMAEDANRVSWLTQLLELLRSAMDWILANVFCVEPEDEEEDVEKNNERIAKQDRIVATHKLYGMFAYKQETSPETKQQDEPVDIPGTLPSI